MNQIKLVLRYFKYWLFAKSDFKPENKKLQDFLSNVLYSEQEYYAFKSLKKHREELLADERFISITDFGAGSRVNKSNRRKVKEIAKYSSKPLKFSKLFFRLTNYFQSRRIVELGTSLGISTSYFASGNLKASVVTIEGCPETAKISKENFKKLSLDNIDVRTGEFSNQLPRALQSLEGIDLGYIDGNHRKEPTLAYFETLLKLVDKETVLIFDDIHWSDEMEEAWEKIKSHKKVTVTIDLFFVGLVFFDSDLDKQDLIIRY